MNKSEVLKLINEWDHLAKHSAYKDVRRDARHKVKKLSHIYLSI